MRFALCKLYNFIWSVGILGGIVDSLLHVSTDRDLRQHNYIVTTTRDSRQHGYVVL